MANQELGPEVSFGKHMKTSHIRCLDLSSNLLRSLQADLATVFPMLTSIDLSKNSLETLPQSFSLLVNVERVRLSRNRFQHVPLVLFSMNKLRHLSLFNNPIASLPDLQTIATIPSHANLTWFDLSDCPIWASTDVLRAFAKRFPNALLDLSVPDCVEQHLFIGNEGSARNETAIRELGITHVLSVCHFEPLALSSVNVQQKIIALDDSPKEMLEKHFPEAFQFLDEAVAANGKCLVHCNAGVSRSCSFLCAYLMWKKAIRFDEALHIVQKARPCVDPNLGFREQLTKYEPYRSPRLAKASDEPFVVFEGCKMILEAEGYNFAEAKDDFSALFHQLLEHDGVHILGDNAAFVMWQRSCGTNMLCLEPNAWEGGLYSWISMVYTSDRFRKRGFARTLNEFVLANTPSKRVFLNVYEFNRPSIEFHERLGFRVYATVWDCEIQDVDDSTKKPHKCGPLDEDGGLSITIAHPYGVSYGAYRHYYVYVQRGRDIQQGLRAAREHGVRHVKTVTLAAQDGADAERVLSEAGFVPSVRVYELREKESY